MNAPAVAFLAQIICGVENLKAHAYGNTRCARDQRKAFDKVLKMLNEIELPASPTQTKGN